MHKFPKDANLGRQLVKYVRVKRANFVEPTEHAIICNIHFSPDCYEKVSRWKWCCTDDTVSSSNKISWKAASDLVYSTRWQCN